MEFYGELEYNLSTDCVCDVHCGNHSYGCDDDNVCGTDTDD